MGPIRDDRKGWDSSSLRWDPKTIKNRVGTFRLIWDKAKAWKYTAETAYNGLSLPEWEKDEQPCFSFAEIAQIIQRSPQPYNTVWRLVAETGIRRGEICGLNVGDVDVNRCILVVRRSRTKKGKLKAPKAGLRNGVVKKRVFSLSPSLTEQLRSFVEGRRVDEPLFLTPGRMTKSGKRLGGGARLEPDNFVKKGIEANSEGVGFRWGGPCLPARQCHSARLPARANGRSTRTPRTRGCEDNNGVYAFGHGR